MTEKATPGKKGNILVSPPLFVVPDVYAPVTGSFVAGDAAGGAATVAGKALTQLSAEVTASLFGATVKLQGSDDAASLATGNWADITSESAAGLAQPIDVPVAAGSTGVLILLSSAVATVGAAAGLAFRSFRLMARNTVAALAAPVSAPIVAAGAAGVLTGAYRYAYTNVNANGETIGSAENAPFTLTAQQGAISGIVAGPAGTTQRKVYRTQAGGAAGSERLLTTIADNVTTVFTDNVADATIVAAAVIPLVNTSGSVANIGSALYGE